ncbi:TonB-dependent receptor [Sphingobacterium alkalisoli]|uniref:TonB-dependent receptor n=1 Tax=Sphingobacterium alkalisoli TaxID=1874115 RepID=A0A4U0GRT3_9SPHI|nr:TonB-dependent receptor [Sphingobacterium alkalisoli]TJY61466.1 TonB-dependent receptor [Sphingobacterium alkalisoli]GGH30238.1 SusC/RagA family TonB-linked outer membrane protein [Sphingobacterium alkalisoli]
MNLKLHKFKRVFNTKHLLLAVSMFPLAGESTVLKISTGAFRESFSSKISIVMLEVNSDAKQQKWKGVVSGAGGEAVSGVEIRNVRTNAVTTSDVNGVFELEALSTDQIQFKIIGYETKTVLAADIEQVMLTVLESRLDEVVVVGYGTQKKGSVTGSVSTVKFDENTVSRPNLNLASALVGASAGLNISQTSAQPGAESFGFLVRGMGTMNDASPLVVIDGVPGALNDVNPNDVESVSVLKDAASSAIYGSRAANGVILVTTKKGSGDKFSVTYNGYLGSQGVAKDIDFITDMATHMELVNESEGREKYGADLIEEWRRESAAGNPLYPNTDWYDEMLNSSLLSEHNLAIRGGGQKSHFAMSMGYLNNKGIVDNSGYERYNFRINADAKVKNFLTLGANIFGSWSDREVLDVSSFFSSIRNTTPGVIPVYTDGRYGGEMFSGLPVGSNPRAYVDNITGNGERQKLSAKFFGIVNLLKNLEWESSFGFNYSNLKSWEYVTPYSLWNLQTDFQYQQRPSVNSLFNNNRRDYSTVLNTLLRFKETFGGSHYVAALLGFDQQYNRMDNFNAKKNDIFGNDAIYVLDAGANMESIGGTGTDDALQSYFGRLNYDYQNKYLFEANARYDGSSRFSKDNRWGFFPSFSAGWRVTEERFAEPLKAIFDDVKIRGSWGKLGNNRIGDYTYQVVYGSYLYPFSGQLQQSVAPKEIANSKIKWETTTISNVGLDLAMLKNRLTLSVEYFDKTTSDILTKIPIPLTMGNFSPPWQNIAEMKNKGFEFQLGYQGKVGELAYQVNGNLSTVSNNVTKFNGDRSISGANITLEGSPYASFYTLEFDRIVQNPEEIEGLVADGYTFGTFVGGKPSPGDILYKDTNGDKVFDAEDRVIKDYSSLPKITYGLNFNVAYKNFDVNVVGQGVGGVKQYWGNDGFNTFNINEGFLQRTTILERWTEENKSTVYPRLHTSGSALNTAVSDYWLYNTSYFRIKSLQLGYALPQNVSTKFKVDRLRLYANLENYFTFTNFEGYNPENASVSYPMMKQWVVGLNVTF